MFTSPSGKSYIGMTTRKFTERQKEHMDKAKGDPKYWYAFHKAINKYECDWNQWIIEILYTSNNDYDLKKYEMEYIAKYNTLSPNGYNLTAGGDGITNLSSEALDKLSQSVRKYFNYKLPRGVTEQHSKSGHGFIVKAKLLGRTYGYIKLLDPNSENFKQNMDLSYDRAMKCYEVISTGIEYIEDPIVLRNLVSESHRRYRMYPSVPGVREDHDVTLSRHGFIVKIDANSKKYCFTMKISTDDPNYRSIMDQLYAEAVKCCEILRRGEKYIKTHREFTRMVDEFEVPNYVYKFENKKNGNIGFKFQHKQYGTQAYYTGTMRQKLIKSIKWLIEKIPYDPRANNALEIEYTIALLDRYENEEQSSTTKCELAPEL
jgi:hypothetical protein